jgi:hypothetical protein
MFLKNIVVENDSDSDHSQDPKKKKPKEIEMTSLQYERADFKNKTSKSKIVKGSLVSK